MIDNAALKLAECLARIDETLVFVPSAPSSYPPRAVTYRLDSSLYNIEGGLVVMWQRGPNLKQLLDDSCGALEKFTRKHACLLRAFDVAILDFVMTTLPTVGVAVSPHMFRTSAASTAATHLGENPHLGSALLHHTDPSVTNAHYNRATSLSAAESFRQIVRQYEKT